MTDILVINLALCAVALLWPAFAWRAAIPQVGPGYDEMWAQARYQKRLALRRAYRWAIPMLAVYVVFRALSMAGHDDTAGPANMPDTMAVLLTCFFIGVTAGMLLRYRGELAFARSHPDFKGSIQPFIIRIGGLATLALAAIVMITGLNIRETFLGLPIIGSSLIVVLVGRRFVLAAVMRSQIREPEGSPFAARVASLVEQFGFKPKHLAVWPNLVANGWALPNGTVAITSALRQICTEDEVLAILAHELSHARDRDAAQIRRTRFAYLLLGGLPFVALSFFLGMWSVPEVCIMPALVLSAVSLSLAAAYPLAKLTHRLEFKCDADVTQFGLGPELASGLRKLHNYMGLPMKFVGADRVLLSHPSTDLRLAAIDQAAKSGIQGNARG